MQFTIHLVTIQDFINKCSFIGISMNKPWENENCDAIFDYYSIYPVPVAAALWCGIPGDQVNKYITESTVTHRGIYLHPKVKKWVSVTREN